ncbi:unnamed protein product [Calicophoron daubneyi]|uniref:Amiloride-sensitive sodium channel n=1 Tax=Calicophoron daubneyi TaxID=300641 RepID=A0AAV2TZ16_CALDB
MSKLYQGPKFLRAIWMFFVVSMSSLLISSTAMLIRDFLNYDVSVHTRLDLDNPSPFPAITVCHQPPFSQHAYEIWRKLDILSPSGYNRYMRKLILEALYKNDVDAANGIWGYDSLSVYYQNLEYNEAVQLGFTPAIYLSCMRNFLNSFSFEDDCTRLKGYRIRRLSHHLYMNCHTFEPVSMQDANETVFFSLVASMGPRDKDIQVQQAFFPDAFEQARGLRIVVHEVGTMPDFERNGLHVEPGKLNEVNYEPVRWTRLATPKRPCFNPNETDRYKDLEEVYNYTHGACLSLHQQFEIMKNCRCIYVMLPRPFLPNSSLPYCGRLWPNYNQTEFIERLQCLSKYLDNDIKRKYDGTECVPRCTYYEYASTTSITKWRGYPWQLYWLRVQNQASQTLVDYHTRYPERNVTEHEAFKQWEVYLKYDNLTQLPNKNKLSSGSVYDSLPSWSSTKWDLESEDFAYVVLKRKSPNIVQQYEKLVLSPYVLISRIGALSFTSRLGVFPESGTTYNKPPMQYI